VSATATAEAPPLVEQGRHRSPAVIVARDVAKTFGGGPVVEGIDLTIHEGETFALVGPSGAGKSTLLQLITGLLAPSRGELQVLGTNPARFGTRERSALGYVPQLFVLYPDLTVEQNARFMAGLYGVGWWRRRRRIRETLELLELWPVRRRRAAAISGGMKRRLSLACALLHRPRLLLVDEPTAGLDPRLRNMIWEHLGDLRESGVSLVLTTQYLDEATRCDRVGIMSGGRLVAVGTPAELRQQAQGGEAIDVETSGFDRTDVDALAALPGVRAVSPRGWTGLRFVVGDAATATPALVGELQRRGVEVESVAAHEPSFDEVFLAFVEARTRGHAA